MPNDQAALAGLEGLLWLLQQMMRSLDQRLASPPRGVLARLWHLVLGKALADQAARATCAMLRHKTALFASSLSQSVEANLASHATDGGTPQDAKEMPVPVAPVSQTAGLLEAAAARLPCVWGGGGKPALIAADLANCAADAAPVAEAPGFEQHHDATHPANRCAGRGHAVRQPGAGSAYVWKMVARLSA